ncbi:biotin--[acetyl-CoA-carboxylase] ligase [Brucella tritici]|jgi:BirA family biotin operon repressor/biotin-[acetyl-CoA-carboxylase] ligase|uniref:biotin--[biotin carboxyl-carrier protein] ligase n=1 Tax=Brucella tritici TaxID=94626 RepID=A0A6N6QKH9_9HYPH|nr:biotin--[acetyl-CoA-carboxylase] ligase [Brucella tritici]KAB2665225.1 biotin--[acetyl-CoA-carboxylase] ligase [Brucella tritici]KAB2678522.1 biotin--[acetyl-CoA-carboxylase] ligase [Brucella tritici]NKW09785.1 biotin--[acetyl-CoA-carboxylase] ligase [Brucella tritici]
MSFALSPVAANEGYRLEAFETVGSTNAVALERAASGDPGKLWLVTKRQESGRGRRGRAWSTPEGNLASTLLLVESYEMKMAATLGFVAGLSLADALDAVFAATGPAVPPTIGLKWPNDVLLNGAKLTGILLESSILAKNLFAVAIGIGTNVVAFPDDLPYAATSLQALGSKCDAETLFAALSDAWSVNYRVWNEGRGLDDIRKRWLQRAHGLGQHVTMQVEGRIVEGRFETIDEACRFVIREDEGSRVAVTAGDVYFGTAATIRR